MAKVNKQNKTDTIILRVPKKLKEILQEKADNADRKLADYVRLELMKAVKYSSKTKSHK
jgi:predicted HicB family RNase H-like nuclease